MSYPTPWQPGQGQSPPPMLASHAERERAVDVLKAGFAEGRLLQPELEQRMARVQQARTVNELALLVADLPQGPVGTPVPPPVPPMPRTFPAPAGPPTSNRAVASMVSLAVGVIVLLVFGFTGNAELLFPAMLLIMVGVMLIRRK